MNNLSFHFQKLETEQNKPKISRRKKIITNTQINKTENRKIIEKNQ